MGNSSSALPFSIGKQVTVDQTGWNLHEGSQKSDGMVVSVFVGKKPDMVKTSIDPARHPGMTQLQPALHHFQNCKRLRHPHILKVYATLDTDNPDDGQQQQQQQASSTSTGDLIVVTEPCQSLESWLGQGPSGDQKAWALQSMVKALHFLHNSAKLCHGNVSPSSFYVNKAGDVKLWNFSLVTPIGPFDNSTGGPTRHFREWEGVMTPQTYRSPERIEKRWEAIQAGGLHAMDSYALGALIQHVYQGNIPQTLQKAVQRLLTPNLKMRPRLQPLLKCPVFQSPYQQTQSQLEELSVQPVEQKVMFWQNLATTLNQQQNNGFIDEGMAIYKILPLAKSSITTICTSESMLSQDLYRREVLAALTPLFFIAERFLVSNANEDFNAHMKPLISLLFNVKDRGIRGFLLSKMHLLEANLDKSALNSKVFEPMCSGFSDSSSALRELTLKSTFGLVPHLSAPNLEKLTRYLVRLQSDPETNIRTNTVIFISKLAQHLTEVAREKLILPAFVRAMKDPFPPCRLASLRAVNETKQYFDPNGLASKVLPVVTPQLLDPASDVRKEAFLVVEGLLRTLRDECDRMTKKEMEREAAAAAANNNMSTTIPRAPSSDGAPSLSNGASTSSYLSGLSSWMTSSAQPTAAAAAPTAPAGVTRPPAAPRSAPIKLTANQINSVPTVSKLSVKDDDGWGDNNDEDGNDGWGDTDGWGDEDDDNDGWGDKKEDNNENGWGDDDLNFSSGPVEEDPFASIGAKTGKSSTTKLSMGGVTPTTKRLVIPKKATTKLTMTKKSPAGSNTPKISSPAPTPPAVTKLAMDDGGIDDGWDDF